MRLLDLHSCKKLKMAERNTTKIRSNPRANWMKIEREREREWERGYLEGAVDLYRRDVGRRRILK